MIALSYAQLVAGCSQPYLQEVKADTSYVPASWLSSIRTFLCLCKQKILDHDACQPKLQCEHN
eukprot:3366454-Ditylum_brightwellii.AAC.2